jgi:predicted NAD/FAD-binding protein
MLRVVIVGGGIAGLAAARALHRSAEVILLEAAGAIGGHAHTVEIETPAGPRGLDCGFIVFNRARYPRFSRLLRHLGVATRASDMSFGVWSEDGSLAYATSGLASFYARAGSLLEPRHHRLLAAILGFLARARRDAATGAAANRTLAEYLAASDASSDLEARFVTPLAAALWSAGGRDIERIPAELFLGFLHAHGMLRPIAPPRWHTVAGGSVSYLRALRRELTIDLRLGAFARRLHRDGAGVAVELEGGEVIAADRAILATHTDQALALLAEPSPEERAALGAIRYRRNHIVLHSDSSRLAPAARARASWSCRLGDDGGLEVSYWLNRLQRIPGPTPYLVTVNPRGPIDDGAILHRREMSHPIFDRAALDARRRIARLQGSRHTYFAGAYLGYGFHEDGYRAGHAAACRLRADWAHAGRRRAEAAA